MEELLLELFNGEWEMEIINEWVPLVQPEPMTFWERFWQTGQTGL